MYTQALDETDYSYQTLRVAKWVAGKIEMLRRRNNIPWSFHKEVASLCPEDQERMLDRVEEEGWTREELRNAIRFEKRVIKIEEVRARSSEIPQGLYGTIVIDPPWPMEKIQREVRPNQIAFG